MATITLGSIKFNWKGAYNSSTAYAVDDVVSSGGNSYVCIQAHTNQAVGNATAYWNIMSSAGTNGTNGTDLTTTLTTQGDIVYRDGSGLQRLAAGTSGQLLKTGGSGANPSWTNAPSGVLKKQHYIEYSTRTAGNSSAGNQFTWTTSFTPLDPVNNDLYVQANVPTNHAGNDWAGYGLRFSKSGGSDYDFHGRGVQYADAATMYMSIQSQTFNIPAGTLAAGTYTIYLRTETNDSNATHYNPNSSNHSRLSTQTRSTLMISEWNN